uniref:Cilia- and flagella-associated protein 97 n=1 Tax=Amphiprion percula TaxID=161767 RepID=A0A3P8TBH2_AMPPE
MSYSEKFLTTLHYISLNLKFYDIAFLHCPTGSVLLKTAMFNPGELEGEVDHSFFDSDCAESSGDGWKKTEKGLKAEKESHAAHETLHAKHAEHAQGDHSLRTERTRKHQKEVENNNSRRVERKERRRASSVSSVSGTSDKVINDSSESKVDSNLHSKSEEEALAFKASTKRRYKQSPKKLLRNRCSQSPSPASSETSADADPESSCSSSSRRSSTSLESPTPSKPNQSSLCPGVRRQSSGSRDLPDIHTEESDDRMTDVSPLSSNDTSPLQSLDLNHREVEKGSHEEEQQQESVPSSGMNQEHGFIVFIFSFSHVLVILCKPSNPSHSVYTQVKESNATLNICFKVRSCYSNKCPFHQSGSLRLESQLESSLVLRCPGGRNRKNYSFTNDEVRRIDRENQRLLRELSRLSPGPRPGIKSPLIRPSHSALNRQREQQRIERENLAFLKRLESVKPTPGLKRSEQLADYQRQVGYLGAPSYPICRSTAKKDRSSTRTASATGARSASCRAASATTDYSSTPSRRSKKLSAARPAWC